MRSENGPTKIELTDFRISFLIKNTMDVTNKSDATQRVIVIVSRFRGTMYKLFVHHKIESRKCTWWCKIKQKNFIEVTLAHLKIYYI